jgi:hypothetical protein
VSLSRFPVPLLKCLIIQLDVAACIFLLKPTYHICFFWQWNLCTHCHIWVPYFCTWGRKTCLTSIYIYIYIIKKIVFIWDAKQRLLGPYLLLWVRFFCFHQINTGVFYACYWWFQFHAWSSISEDISKCEINTSVLRWNMGWCYLIIFNIHSTAFSTIWNMWPSR